MKHFVAFLLFFNFLMVWGAKPSTSFSKPDFAYPKSVIANAQVILNKSLVTSDWDNVVKALLQQSVAIESISRAALPQFCKKTDSIAQIAPFPYSTLLYSIEAEIYHNIYLNNPREIENYSDTIISLVKKSLIPRNSLESTPLRSISPLLDKESISDATFRYYPTLFDFLSARALSMCSSFYNIGNATIPFLPLHPSSVSPASAVAENIYKSLFEFNINNPTALIPVIISYSSFKYGDNSGIYLKHWLDTLSDTSESIAILCQLYGKTDVFSDAEFYNISRRFLEKFPKADYTPNLKEILAQLSMPQVSFLDAKTIVCPNQTIKLPVKMFNANNAEFVLKSTEGDIIEKQSLQNNINALPFEVDDTIFFQNPGIGNYILSATHINGKELNKAQIPTSVNLMVRSLEVLTTAQGAYIVNRSNNKPIAGAKVEFLSGYNKNTKSLGEFSSDANGLIAQAPKNASSAIVAIPGTQPQNIDVPSFPRTSQNSRDHKLRKEIKILTDRSIYHPGDTIRGCLIAYSNLGNNYNTIDNAHFKLFLNGPGIDSVSSCESFIYGMGRGEFSLVIPDQGVTGQFNITAQYEGNNKDWVISRTFLEVADYKLPSFFIDSEKPKLNNNILVIAGKASTYRGMPVASAKVKLKVTYSPYRYSFYRGRRLTDASYCDTVITNGKGEYSITLGIDSLKGTPYEKGIYRVETEVTSISGETQYALNSGFVMGDDFSWDIKMAEIINAESPDTIAVKILNATGEMQPRQINYKIYSKSTSSEIRCGTFESPVCNIDFNKIPSGEYVIEFISPVDSLIEKLKFVLWREADKYPPLKSALWVPQTVYTSNVSGITNLRYGSSFSDKYVLCRIADEDGIIRSEWICTDGQMGVLNVKNPPSGKSLWINLTAMNCGDVVQKTIIVVNPDTIPELKIETISFRDKIYASDKERWTFRFCYSNSQGAKNIAAMAVMTDKALDALRDFEWDLSLPHTAFRSGLQFARVNYNYPSPIWGNWSLQFLNVGKYFSLSYPGIKYLSNERIFIESVNSPLLYASAAKVKSRNASYESVVADSAAGVMEEAFEDAGDAEELNNRQQWSPAELPLAFFKPNLVTDSIGNVDINFIVPDFNTTWKFQLLGYDSSMYSAKIVKQATASKPVMIKLTTPRFLRASDKICINATIDCNATAAMQVSAYIEILNASNDSVIASMGPNNCTMPPSSSRTIALDFSVPQNINSLIIRARAIGGNHSDGEQVLIGVLPESTDVIESKNYYIAPGADEFTITVPPLENSSTLIFSYCNNPVWLAVESLPALATSNSACIFSSLMALVGNSITAHLVETIPELRSALESWKESEAPKSRLALSDNLKIFELSNTIWFKTAENANNRISLLSEYLDSTAIESSTEKIINSIIKLQHPSGGWAWLPESQPSYWVSSQVLSWLGHLNHIDALPNDANLQNAISRGIAYCDSTILNQWQNHNKNHDLTFNYSWIDYLYTRSLIDKPLPTALKDWKNKTLHLILKEWRNFDIQTLSTATILTYKSGNKAEAIQMLESLRQKALIDQNHGMWFDNLTSTLSPWNKLKVTAHALEAFYELQPESKDVDLLRQWLVERLLSQEWSDNQTMAYVIRILLNTGTRWLAPCNDTKIKIGETDFTPSKIERLTGAFTLAVSPGDGSQLSINRNCNPPAWCSLISTHQAPIASIDPYRCDEIAITKSIEPVSNDSVIRIGDKVKINLMLDVADDMQYVVISDQRPSCLEPIDQHPRYVWCNQVSAYCEPRTATTNFFIDFLAKGKHILTYECNVAERGEFASGIASVQSQQSPSITAHSGGFEITVSD